MLPVEVHVQSFRGTISVESIKVIARRASASIPVKSKLCRNFSKSLERFRVRFTANRKREFVPPDQVSPLLVVYCSLLLPQKLVVSR